MLAALAVGGWVFIGFDACVGASEETRGAARHVPRAIWFALLSVAAVVMLNAVAAELAHPNPADIVAGRDIDPVSTAVVSSFGTWSAKPFAAVVLMAFLACGMAAQALTARTIFSVARDGVLPASRFLRRVDRRGAPIGAIAATSVIACLALLLGLNSAAVGSLIAFGTAAIYVAFLLVAVAALVARLRGSWVPAGRVTARPRRPAHQRARRGLARLRDSQHRLAAHIARPSRCARVSDMGCSAPARRDRSRRILIPVGRQAAPQAGQALVRALQDPRFEVAAVDESDGMLNSESA